MKTDKISFGTRTKIGIMTTDIALPKYKTKLASGILDAFEKLSNNTVYDELQIHIRHKKGAKNLYTDSLEIIYFPQANTKQSSKALSPKTLEKLSAQEISNTILRTYQKLKQSKKIVDSTSGNVYQPKELNVISKTHKEKINTLNNNYGIDDLTCA